MVVVIIICLGCRCHYFVVVIISFLPVIALVASFILSGTRRVFAKKTKHPASFGLKGSTPSRLMLTGITLFGKFVTQPVKCLSMLVVICLSVCCLFVYCLLFAVRCFACIVVVPLVMPFVSLLFVLTAKVSHSCLIINLFWGDANTADAPLKLSLNHSTLKVSCELRATTNIFVVYNNKTHAIPLYCPASNI